MTTTAAQFLCLLLCTLLTTTTATCGDQCSGHGSCGKKDKCVCQNGYMGINCAGKVCLFGYAWSGVPISNDLRAYAECSNAGICDRKTGLCDCNPGFTGGACRRLACPNQCSGHGTCKKIGDLARDVSPLVNGRLDRKYNLFDKNMAQSCKCDPGYVGPDCSQRTCARGDDPLTNHTDFLVHNNGLVAVQVQSDETQKLMISGVHDLSGYFTLQYTDQFNMEWTTRPIRVENNVGTTKTVLIYADNSGKYFSGATYEQKLLNAWGSLSTNAAGTTSYYCPFGDPACQQECPFGSGYQQGDRLSITGTGSQTETIFTVTAASPCKLYVEPAPVTTSIAEKTTIKLLSSGTGVAPLTGVGGVLQSLRSLPNQVIPDIMVTERLKFNSKKEFDITFNHQDNAGDQKNIQCDPVGCDVDGCQPRFKGLKKSIATIVFNSRSNSNYQHYVSFTVVSGTNDDTITVSNYNLFTNKLKIGDTILIEGTTENNGRTYTINALTSNVLTVNEDVVTEYYSNGIVFFHPSRGFHTSRSSGENHDETFSMSVVSGFTEHNTAGAPGWPSYPRSNQISFEDDATATDTKEFKIISRIDTFQDVMVGDKLTMTATSDTGYNAFKDIQYEVVAIDVEVHVVHPLNVTATTDTSAFTVVREAGACNVTELVKGTKESALCGNRGKCNEKTGICDCFIGYHGSTCSTQVTLV